jgi:hypothetical protein
MKKWGVICSWMIMAALVLPGCGGKTEEAKAPGTPGVTAPSAAPPVVAPSQAPGTEAPSAQVPVPVPGKPAAAEVPVKPSEAGIIAVARFTSGQIVNGSPAGWVLESKSGTPFVRIEKDANTFYLHLSSDSESSFGVRKEIKVNISEYPFLNWRWKVTRLPRGGDVRDTGTDDQALQIYVAFPATGWPEKLNTPVVGYIWDSEAPRGWMGSSSHTGAGMLRYVVVRNKTDRLGQWFTEKRNIYQDYRTLFKDVKGGQPPGPTQGVQFYINSQHTQSAAESYICEVYFSKS